MSYQRYADRMFNKKSVFALLCMLCVLDNILTYHLLQWPIYQEVGPLSVLALEIPYGLWFLKAGILFVMSLSWKYMTVQFLNVITLLMFIVVCWNLHLYLGTV